MALPWKKIAKILWHRRDDWCDRFDAGRYVGRYEGEMNAIGVFGVISMAQAIAAKDRTSWKCGDCGRNDLTWQSWCPTCEAHDD